MIYSVEDAYVINGCIVLEIKDARKKQSKPKKRKRTDVYDLIKSEKDL